MEARTGWPVDDTFVTDDDEDSDATTESNFCLRYRSFLNRVRDRFRKTLDRSTEDAMQDIDQHSMIMLVASTMTWERNHKHSENHNLKHMLKIFEKLTLEQSDEIVGVSLISWEDFPWKQCWRSHQFLACKGLLSQILFYVLDGWMRTQH